MNVHTDEQRTTSSTNGNGASQNGAAHNTETPEAHVRRKAESAKAAATQLRTASSATKDAALLAMADALVANAERIYNANVRDIEAGRARGLSEAMLDRLRLDEKRIRAMADGCRQVAALPDPIGQVIKGWKQPNNLSIQQVRVPLGVIGVIYESRPNVTV
ncbi:MAG TPA: hypothetical protein VF719_06715, partial [Abditibacteriaceae bacterium]